MEYRCAATSIAGFVQQLVSCYLPHGYWFYIMGMVPDGKAPEAVDQKLIAKYGIGISRSSRARRKAMGIANLHYLRHEGLFVLLATHGHHPFYDEEKSIADVRRTPIKFAGYAISVKPGGYLAKSSPGSAAVRDTKQRVHVQISQRRYLELKRYFVDIARRRSGGYVEDELRRLPFEPYAPVRQQLLNILRLVNRIRRVAGREAISPRVLRYQRHIVRPFAPRQAELRENGLGAILSPSGGQQDVPHHDPLSVAEAEFDNTQACDLNPKRSQGLDETFLNWATRHLDKSEQ
jgi:hypothetical protein